MSDWEVIAPGFHSGRGQRQLFTLSSLEASVLSAGSARHLPALTGEQALCTQQVGSQGEPRFPDVHSGFLRAQHVPSPELPHCRW